MTKRSSRLVFLLYLWLVEEGGKPAWRASLETARGGEKRVFSGLDDLFAFILEMTRRLVNGSEQKKEVKKE
jgi:hypothetical protein